MSKLSLSASFEYLCYGFQIVYSSSAETVFRCQILVSEDGPRTERVNYPPPFLSSLEKSYIFVICRDKLYTSYINYCHYNIIE